jgi:hypothetical protein
MPTINRAIQRSGFLPCQPPSATAIPSVPSSCSLLPSHPVRVPSAINFAALNNDTGPRFALVALWYILTRRPNSSLPKFVAGVGIFRTLTCGGWTYVTSTDDHDWHDIFMISYLVATLPWTLGCFALSPRNPTALKYRKVFGGAFFATLVPLIYFFIQHKVHRIPGGGLFFPCLLSMLTACSLHHLRLLRVVARPSRCGLRRSDCDRVRQLRDCCKRCPRCISWVRSTASALDRRLYECKC